MSELDELTAQLLARHGPDPAWLADGRDRLKEAWDSCDDVAAMIAFLRELVLEVEPFAAEDASHHALHRWTDVLDMHSDSLRRLVLVRDLHVHDRPEDEGALRARFPLLSEIVLVPARDE